MTYIEPIDRVIIELLLRAFSEHTTQYNLAATCGAGQDYISRLLVKIKKDGLLVTYRLIHIGNAKKKYRAYGIPCAQRKFLLVQSIKKEMS